MKKVIFSLAVALVGVSLMSGCAPKKVLPHAVAVPCATPCQVVVPAPACSTPCGCQ